jgi:hypothetical protein
MTRFQWLSPEIPATQEAKIRSIQPKQTVHETLSQKKPFTTKKMYGGWGW